MKPIFSNNGQVVAWQDNENIYHLDGTHSTVIDDDNVYGHSGQHLGVLNNGLFRDYQGGAVAFIEGASGGPILPIPAIPPIPQIPAIPPIPATPSIPPIPAIPAIPSMGWGISWEQFING